MSNATFTFGRFNPPTEEGHGKLVSAVQKHAEETGGKHYIFPTHSQDKKKNPMSHEDKVGAMHKLFPSANVVSHDKVRTVVDAMKHLESKGHKNVTMVVGSDRVDSFHKMLNDYREKEYPGIKKVNVVSAGHRDPDAEGAEGMSASKLRGLVASGKKKEFVSHYSDPKLGAQIHDKVKAGMQMESANPVGIFLLGGPGSGKDYVLNNIFSRFDLIEVQVDQLINGSANELVEQKKNIVINGAIDADKMAIVESILDGYMFDSVFVSVTNKVSRLRNALRDNPLSETKRIEKFLAAEKLAETIENSFVFNNSINLNESSDLERVFFGSQIEKLLSRLVEHGLAIQEKPEPKSFVSIKEKYSHSHAQQAAIAIAMKKAGKKPKHMKEDIRYAEKTQFPPIESLRLKAEKIAEKHKVSPAEILDHLAVGISVEYGNTHDYNKAMGIAVKNLEKQSDYYSKSTTVQEQLQRPKVPAMRYVASEVEKVKASQQKDRQLRVRHRWFDHKNADVSSIARKKFEEVEVTNEKKEKYDIAPLGLSIKNPKTGQKGIGYTMLGDDTKPTKPSKKLNPVAVDLGAKAALRQPTSITGVQVDSLSEKTFPPVKHDKSGLPKKYVAGLTPAEIKAKKAAIKHNAKLSDSNPEAYKDMPGDKRVRAKGIPLSKYTKKYHAMYGEEVEQLLEFDPSEPSAPRGGDYFRIGKPRVGSKNGSALSKDKMMQYAKKAMKKATKKATAKNEETDKPMSYAEWKNSAKKQGKPNEGRTSLKNVNADPADTAREKMKKIIKSGRRLHGEEVEQVEEGAADTSLAGKAKKSGVSLSTLRKVYNRGVAAWNSGHRPGTTPAQWGHARVNSYITHGKTYHTADKDLHEEEMVRGTNCKNCIFWKEGSEKPVGKDELNENGGLKAPNDKYVEMSKHVDLVTLPGEATVKFKAYCENDKVMDFVTERMCCALWDGEGTKRDYKGDATFMEDANTLFERQFDGTDSYRQHAIAMTPGQSQEIKDARGTAQPIQAQDQCGCGGGCDCNSISDSPTGASGNRITRSLKQIKEGIKEAKEEEKLVDIAPTIQTKRKKGSKVRPIDTFDSTLQGMPTVSTAFAEDVQYHVDNNISLIENVFRPGSDKFFEMIGEAKRLYKEGKYEPKDEYEKELLESDIGEIAEYEGQLVVLDYPVEEGLQEACWSGYTQKGMKKKGDKMVPNCVPVNEEDKTGGHGIGKPFRSGGGGAVYVRSGDGGVRKVNFSQSGMKKRFMEPGRVKSFVARHHCLTNKDKTSASYWACRWPRFFSNSGKTWW